MLSSIVDSSESVASRLAMTIKEIDRALSQNPIGAGDGLSIISFSGFRPVELCNRDCRGSTAVKKLRLLKASGPTPLFDAVAYCANVLSQHRALAVRPVAILFSDGDDTISRISAGGALQSLLESGASLYAIDLNDSERSPGSAVLRHLTDATGGIFSSRPSISNLLQSVLDDLHASWVVTYEAPNGRVGFHSLRILPKRDPSIRFHCRGGYFYGTHAP
jgi:Mg-chelatase subunit ChlD